MEQMDYQRQSRAEVIAHFFNSAKGIDGLEGKSVAEVFSNEKSIRQLIDTLSEQQFIQLLNGLNGIIRGVGKESWGMAEGEMEISGAMESEAVFTAKAKDKPLLLAQMIRVAKKMNQEQRSMNDIALLVSVTTNAIHPWEDANGRTSRLIFALLEEGYARINENRVMALMSEEGSSLLTTDARSISGYLDSALRKECGLDFGNLFSDKPTKEWRFPEGVDDSQKNSFIRAYKADYLTHLAFAVADFLKTTKKDANKYYQEMFHGRKVVLLDKLLNDLNSEDIEEILNNYFKIKKRKVELLIDCIENPDKQEYQIETGEGDRISLLEKLEMRVKAD